MVEKDNKNITTLRINDFKMLMDAYKNNVAMSTTVFQQQKNITEHQNLIIEKQRRICEDLERIIEKLDNHSLDRVNRCNDILNLIRDVKNELNNTHIEIKNNQTDIRTKQEGYYYSIKNKIILMTVALSTVFLSLLSFVYVVFSKFEILNNISDKFNKLIGG